MVLEEQDDNEEMEVPAVLVPLLVLVELVAKLVREVQVRMPV